MAAILQSLGRTVIAGIVVLIVIVILAGVGTGQHGQSPDMDVVEILHALAPRPVGRHVDRPAVVLQLRADAVDAEDSGRAEARGQQGDRADGAVLVPLGGARHRR